MVTISVDDATYIAYSAAVRSAYANQFKKLSLVRIRDPDSEYFFLVVDDTNLS